MDDRSAYPSLVEKALRYLERRAEASEGELCAYLFGLPPKLLAGPALEKWSRLLRDCLGGDRRLVSPSPGRWALRAAIATPEPGAGSLDALEIVAIAVAADGPRPWRDRIVGVAALQSGGTAARGARALGRTTVGTLVLGRWESVTRPETPRRLPAYLRELGLGPASLEEAPTFAEVADDFVAFVGDRPLVGVDVGLAVAYLQFELRRAGRPALTNPLIDLGPLADLPALTLPRSGARKLDLDALAAELGVPPADRRSLRSRARLTADVARVLLGRAAEAGIVTLESLRAAIAAAPSPTGGLEAVRPRFLLDRSSLDSFPTDPGAYMLLDSDDRVHYVGKATCLRARLAAYLVADLGRTRSMAGVVEATARVETETTATELEALLLEARLIERYQPRYNVQRRQESDLAYLRRGPAADVSAAGRGARWAQFVRACTPECLGPIRLADGRRLLAAARKQFRLGGKRGTARWTGRADAAWKWVAEQVEGTPVFGDLTSHDLGAFALVAPWPPLPAAEAVEVEVADDELAIGHEGWIQSGGAEAVETDPRYDPVCDRRARACPPPMGPGGGDNAPPTVGEVSGDPRSERRIVVLGKSGWLGSLTVDATASADEVRRLALELALSAGQSASQSAAAELAVALRFATQAPERLLLLRSRTSAQPAGA